MNLYGREIDLPLGFKIYRAISHLMYFFAVPCQRFSTLCQLKDPLFNQRFFWKNPLKHTEFDCWFHAVSVGEVMVAQAIVEALLQRRPGLKILVSSSTPQGLAILVGTLGDSCSTMVFPVDFPQVVERVVGAFKTRVYVTIETELWPNLILELRRRGARCIVLNGRISRGSFRFYKRLQGVFRPVVQSFSSICVISEEYRRRFLALGALEDSVTVTGNAKFEGLLRRPNQERREQMKEKLNIRNGEKVLCLGSIRGGEEDIVLQAVHEIQEGAEKFITLIVPRHPERARVIEKQLTARGVSFDLWSEMEMGKKRSTNWVIVDVIGPLYDLYGISTCAFVGGSLVPKGGQNLMEPASWGVPVLYGPHVENFEDAASALKRRGGGIMVRDRKELSSALKKFLKDPITADNSGRKARETLVEMAQGAATRQVQAIEHALDT